MTAGAEKTSADTPWVLWLGVAASAVAVLAFFGVPTFTDLRHALAAKPTSSPKPHPAYSADVPQLVIPPTSATPSDSPSPTTASPSPSPSPSPAPALQGDPGAVPPFDPGTLDDASTDHTPLTAAATMPSGFTTSMGIGYSFAASGIHLCDQAYDMTANVKAALLGVGCAEAITGDYLASSGQVTDTNEVLVSVQVFPLQNAATAQGVYQDLINNAPGDFGIWCPLRGRGQAACSNGYASAHKRQFIRPDHRYLIAAEALYTDLTSDPGVDTWEAAAAQRADQVCGPEFSHPG